jgi:hypothetical protein
VSLVSPAGSATAIDTSLQVPTNITSIVVDLTPNPAESVVKAI